MFRCKKYLFLLYSLIILNNFELSEETNVSTEKRFHVVNFKVNWFQAYQYCRRLGMDLVSIPNEEKNVELTNYIIDSGLDTLNVEWWTSGINHGWDRSFIWMGSGRRVTFTDWYENSKDRQDCLEMRSLGEGIIKWNDRDCSHQSFFICEVL